MRADRFLALLVALILCVGAMPAAMAETQYPPRPQGAVADLANVLGEQAIQDMDALSSRLRDQTGGQLFVLTRHFLGGMSAQTYASKVFEVWGLSDMDALLLMVIGEESYALALGKAARNSVANDTQISLLATHFRDDFLRRNYDQAMADLETNLAQTLAKAYGDPLDVTGLFGQASIQSTPQPVQEDDWWYGMFAQDDYDARESDDSRFWQDYQNEWRYEETRINWRSVIIWGLVIYFLFFRRKRRHRSKG